MRTDEYYNIQVCSFSRKKGKFKGDKKNHLLRIVTALLFLGLKEIMVQGWLLMHFSNVSYLTS